MELFVLNRGSDPDRARGATALVADLHDEAATERALAGHRFDAVVDWIAFTPEDVERDLRLFRDRTDQFVFISSASAYLKPLGDWLIREDTPLANPFWDYSQNKIACEERLMRAYREDGFPVTIVRPSLTYGDTQVPLAVNSWERPFTAIARMRAGKPLIVPGDGTSLWTITHNSDFAVASWACWVAAQAIGHAFNIMSDEVLTWDEIYRQTAAAAGVEARIVHIASDFIAACLPEMRRHAAGRQGRERGLRHHQDQALRARLPRHDALLGGDPADRRLVRRGPRPTAGGRRDGRPVGSPDRRLRAGPGERTEGVRPGGLTLSGGPTGVPLDFGVGLLFGGLRLWFGGPAAPAAKHVLANLATWWLL